MERLTKKPFFVLWLSFIVQLPLQVFLTIWFAGFFGGFSRSLFGITGSLLYIVLGVTAFIAIPCVSILGKKLSYAQTEYSFFEDHVEVVEGFFSRQMKSVAYSDIREVTLRRGLLQRLCGLGSIYLGTLATGAGPQFNPFSALGFDSVTASGVSVRDLSDPEAAYSEIRKRIEDAKAAALRGSGFCKA